jgi:hypothetical protein
VLAKFSDAFLAVDQVFLLQSFLGVIFFVVVRVRSLEMRKRNEQGEFLVFCQAVHHDFFVQRRSPVYRPSELFSHLMNSLQDGLPLWMHSFSFKVTTGHIRHNKHLPPVLVFLVSAGRGTATSEDIISPCV